jgi:hypothetical protein
MSMSVRKVSGLAIIVLLLIAGGGCKSKKKAMEAAAAKARQEEAALQKQREEEALKRAREAEEKARLEYEAAAAAALEREKARNSAPAVRVEGYFNAIAGASSVTSANNSIQEALTLFASEDTPVFIVIHEAGGQKDYDKPTTIKTYLHYLKDQKKNINRVLNLQLDDAGKIKELELVKQ